VRALVVLYDARCGFCSSCRSWLEEQTQLVPLSFLSAGSPEASRRFPGLASSAEPEELIVVDDEGGVYRGADAWILCLWALDEYRQWSFRLANPALRPLARRAFEWVSHRRKALSRLLRLAPDADVAAALETGSPDCRGGACGLRVR
jgi:predicted DCC family thiol-disulfide oxidoreductase YuxK